MIKSVRKVALVGALGLGLTTLTGPTIISSRQTVTRPAVETIIHRLPQSVPVRKSLFRSAMSSLPSPYSFKPIPQVSGMTDPKTTGNIVAVFGGVGLCSLLLGILGPKKEDE